MFLARAFGLESLRVKARESVSELPIFPWLKLNGKLTL